MVLVCAGEGPAHLCFHLPTLVFFFFHEYSRGGTMVTTFTHGHPWARAKRFNTLITDSVLSRALVDSKLTDTIIHVIPNTCLVSWWLPQ
jgi:hypothetical protein